jgi:molybdate transport system substrate-binding protein
LQQLPVSDVDLCVSACPNSGPTAVRAADPKASGKSVTVLAAASLSAVFGAAKTELEATGSADRVELSFAGSSSLVEQILQGAPADVFASADEENMRRLVDAGQVVGSPRVFARNALAIAVAPGNPKGISALADLTKPGLAIALCGPSVPAGRYARQAFARAGVTPPESSQETDVKAALNKVVLGEVDAAVVYTTDVRAARGKADGVTIPEAHDVIARYPVAVLKEARNPEGAEAFVAFLLAPRGRKLLEEYGFLAPE